MVLGMRGNHANNTGMRPIDCQRSNIRARPLKLERVQVDVNDTGSASRIMCASLKAKFDSKQHDSFRWFNVSSIISSSPDGPGSASASDQRSRAFVLQSRPRCPQHGVRHERLLRVQTTIRRA